MLKNKKNIMILIPVVGVVLIIAIALILNPQTGSDDISPVLVNYFEAYYKTGNVESLTKSLPTELRAEADLAYTLGGSLNLLANYSLDTKAKLGEDFDVIVKIVNRTEPSAALRNKYKTQFYNVTMAVAVGFELELKGAEQSLNFKGASDMVKIGNDWFLVNYSIPLYEQN